MVGDSSISVKKPHRSVLKNDLFEAGATLYY
jgi:hypothetical protein